jgi:hypothetical protein
MTEKELFMAEKNAAVIKLSDVEPVDPVTSKVLEALTAGLVKRSKRRAPYSKTFEKIGGRWKADIDDPF